MSKKLDLTGQQYGELTALERVEIERNGRKRVSWICRCSCGNLTTVRLSNLRNGHTKSCGHCTHYVEEENFIRCIIRGGRSFIFSKEDLPIVQQYSWSMDQLGYVRGHKQGHDRRETIKLHRLLVDAPKNMVVDHINGDPSDCRRENLRIVTQKQNTWNSGQRSSSTTGYKGVCFDKKAKKYMAHIHPDGRMVFLGYYDDPVEAALVYDKAALEYFGEYAKPNFPIEGNAGELLRQEIIPIEMSMDNANQIEGRKYA